MTDSHSSSTCYRCGYDLRGIADDSPCPECGLLAGRSRRASDELAYTRAPWIRQLARGCRLILLALAMAIVVPFVLSDIVLPHVDTVFVIGCSLCLSTAMFAAGIWLLAMPERHELADRSNRKLRFAVRLLSILLFLSVGLITLSVPGSPWATAFTWHWRWHLTNLWTLCGVALTAAACIPLPWLIFRLFRSLAVRVRSPHLTEHCTIAGIGASTALAVLVAVYGITEFIYPLRIDSPYFTHLLMGFMTIWLGVILFFLWSLYLLLRFTFALSRVSRQLAISWKQDDRSLVP